MWALCWKFWTCALILWWTGLCSAATSVQACRCRCASGWTSDLQVWHIPALVLEMFSWCEHSISSPPSLRLSIAGLTQRGLSPAQITQLEMSNQRDQREEGAHFTDRLQVTGEDKGLCLKQGREAQWQTRDLTAHTHLKATDLKLLTSASALCDFFASVLESVALASQQHEMQCTSTSVDLMSTKAVERRRGAVKWKEEKKMG